MRHFFRLSQRKNDQDETFEEKRRVVFTEAAAEETKLKKFKTYVKITSSDLYHKNIKLMRL